MANQKQSLMLKILLIGFLSICLLIPLFMVSGLVTERESRRAEAVKEVSAKWGHSQKITGPVLVIPFKKRELDSKKRIITRVYNAYFLPERLQVTGKIDPEKRSRGLYEVILYDLKNMAFLGEFVFPDFKKLKVPQRDVLWNDAYVALGIPDTRGIQKGVLLSWNDRKIVFEPGVKNVSIFASGISADVEGLKRSRGKKIRFHYSLDLKGSSTLSFTPVGKETQVKLTSRWKHPSFFGAYLPDKRDISDDGFKSQWNVSYFGRNFPQQWRGDANNNFHSLDQMAFGVQLYQPVDFYQKCERAVKYGILFISLTFLSFFLFEIFNKMRIHPVQYIMVGAALCIFYLLFLSLSEHMNFIGSYILSTLGVIAMITGYCIKVLQTKKRAGIMFGLLAGLYFYMYILLENQDYALLLGSLGLFVITGIVMYITRNIDWYDIQLGDKSEFQAETTAE